MDKPLELSVHPLEKHLHTQPNPEADLLTASLGLDFGSKQPHVCNLDLFNATIIGMSRLRGVSKIIAPLLVIMGSKISDYNAKYDPKLDVVIVRKDDFSDKLDLLHENTHAWVWRVASNRALSSVSTLKDGLDYIKTQGLNGLSENQAIEELFINQLINEGVAEYCTVQTAIINQTTRPADYHSAIKLHNHLCQRIGISEQNPFEPPNLPTRIAISQRISESFIQAVSQPKALDRLVELTLRTDRDQYRAGYLFVSDWMNTHKPNYSSLSEALSDLINHPPKSVSEFTQKLNPSSQQ